MQNLAKYCRSPFKSQGLDGLVVLCIHQGQSINVQTGPPASPNRPAPNLKVSTKRRRDAQTDIKQSNNVVSFCGVDLFVQFHVSVSQSSFPLAKVLDIKAAKLLSGRLCVRVTTTHLGATFQIQSVQRPKYTKRLQRQSIKDTKSSKTCHIIPLKNIHRLHPLVPMATQKKKYDARSAGHELGPLSCDIFQLEPSSASGFTGALANCRWYNLQVDPRLSKTNAVTHCRTHSICEYAEKQCCIPCYHVLFYDAKMMGFFGLFLLMSRS